MSAPSIPHPSVPLATSLLAKLLEVPHDKGVVSDAASGSEGAAGLENGRSLSGGTRARCVGERGVSMLQHAALLWKDQNQLITLSEAVMLFSIQLPHTSRVH